MLKRKKLLLPALCVAVFLGMMTYIAIGFALPGAKDGQGLSDYVSALQATAEGSAEEQELIEKIISVSQTLQALPGIPDEALRYEGRAEAAVQRASEPADFVAAAEEYKKAIRIAPWEASYYYNLGLVLEKAGKHGEAIRDFRLYLLAAPEAQDAREVKKKIAGLEYEMEAVAQEETAREVQRNKDEELAEQLVGTWHPPKTEITNSSGQRVKLVMGYRIKIRRNGQKIYADCIGVPSCDENLTQSWYAEESGLPLPYMEGKIENGEFIGTVNSITYGGGSSIFGTKQYRSKIDMNWDGESYTAIDPHSAEGKEYTMLKE